MKFRHCFQRAAAIMACLMLFCNVASAAGTARPSYKQLTEDQLDAKCSLTLTYKKDDTVLPETNFTLYKVADMDENIRFTLTEQFESYPVFAKSEDGHLLNSPGYNGWDELASTLAGYVAADAAKLTSAAQVKSNNEGKVIFTGLDVGLYLIVGERSSVGRTTYTPVPALVALPNWVEGDWSFNPTGAIKHTERTDNPGPGPGTNTLERRALKVWNDEGNEDARPEEIVVELLQDGAVYDTVTLNAANNWRAAWTGLSANSQWQMVERLDSDDYVVSIAQEGVTFVVTNTFVQEIEPENPPLIDLPDEPTPTEPGNPGDPGDPGDPAEPDDPSINVDIDDPDVPLIDLPQTGQLWWPVPLMAAGGVAMILVGLARRRNGSYDE